jgi:hypothetical protein
VLTHALGHANGADRAYTSFPARPRERRLPREALRLHQILASGGSIQWAQQSAAAFCRGCNGGEFREAARAAQPWRMALLRGLGDGNRWISDR